MSARRCSAVVVQCFLRRRGSPALAGVVQQRRTDIQRDSGDERRSAHAHRSDDATVDCRSDHGSADHGSADHGSDDGSLDRGHYDRSDCT